MMVEEVLKDTTGSVKPLALVSVVIPGGAVQFASGKTVTWLVKQNDYEIKPGQRYLVFLTHVKQGNFFIEDKTWLLANGKAVPNTVEDELRGKASTSKYSGQPESAFLSAVRQTILSSK